IVVRRGRFNRKMIVQPHGRTQSIGLSRGPVGTLMRATTFAMHSVLGPGGIRAPHLDESTAMQLLVDQARRAHRDRGHEDPNEWARRVGAPGAVTPESS